MTGSGQPDDRSCTTGASVAQLHDDVVLTLTLPPWTEEWAEDLLAETPGQFGAADTVTRTDQGLVLTKRIGGNCSALANARSWLAEVEDALDEGEIHPMSLTLTASAVVV